MESFPIVLMTPWTLWMTLSSRIMNTSRTKPLNWTENWEQFWVELLMIAWWPKVFSSCCKFLAIWFNGIWLLKNCLIGCQYLSQCWIKKWMSVKWFTQSRWIGKNKSWNFVYILTIMAILTILTILIILTILTNFEHFEPSIDAKRGSTSRKQGVIYCHQLG